ncbi:hypothetical protein [[Eubacterium] hominis]|uniref:hypothetical protein n=1 Tax=[Eubacterium] hominis TaxID=2764325 RepID=UPI003A4D4A4D
MFQEIKRALLKKSNIILFILIVCLMLVNTYYKGWRTALLAKPSIEFTRQDDLLFFKHYYGNVFRVWSGSYYMVQALAPLILISPYILSYYEEKKNNFRNFMTAREGRKKYLIKKIMAIAISGTMLLAMAELCFAIITYFFTYHDVDLEFIENLVSYKESFFLKNPYVYFLLLFGMQTIYYFSFIVFSVGITAMLKNKIAIIIVPFLIVGVLDMIFPSFLQPNVVMQPLISTNFTLYGFIIMIIVYLLIGIISYVLNENRYLKSGN